MRGIEPWRILLSASEPARLGERTCHQLTDQLVSVGGGVEAVGEAVALPPVGAARGTRRRGGGREGGCGAGGEVVGGQTIAVRARDGAGRSGDVGQLVLRWIDGLVLEVGVEVHHRQAAVAAQRGAELGVEGLHPAVEHRGSLGGRGGAIGSGDAGQHEAEARRERDARRIEHRDPLGALVQDIGTDGGRELRGHRLHVQAAYLGEPGGTAREGAGNGGRVELREQQRAVGGTTVAGHAQVGADDVRGVIAAAVDQHEIAGGESGRAGILDLLEDRGGRIGRRGVVDAAAGHRVVGAAGAGVEAGAVEEVVGAQRLVVVGRDAVGPDLRGACTRGCRALHGELEAEGSTVGQAVAHDLHGRHRRRRRGVGTAAAAGREHAGGGHHGPGRSVVDGFRDHVCSVWIGKKSTIVHFAGTHRNPADIPRRAGESPIPTLSGLHDKSCVPLNHWDATPPDRPACCAPASALRRGPVHQRLHGRAGRRGVGMVGQRHDHVAAPSCSVHDAGERRHVAQRAGLEVRGTGCAAHRGAAQSAVRSGDGQGRQQFRHDRRSPCRLQHARERCRAHARLAAQARAVVQHGRFAPRHALAPPLGHRVARAVEGGRAVLLQRDGQEELLRHHVVAVFVDGTHRFGQGRGRHGERWREPRRHPPLPHAAGELAAQFAPHALHRAGREALWIGWRDRPDALATGRREHALEGDTARGIAYRRLRPQRRAPVSALRARRRERHRGGPGRPGHRRFGHHARKLGRHVGHESQRDGFEVDQQRIRRGVVGAQRLAVEQPGVMGRKVEGGAIEHEVADDDLHTLCLQAPQHQPEPLHHQLRVAHALDVHIAAQAAALRPGVQIDRGVPGVGRPQQFQRGVGGDELHHRCRIHGLLRAPGQAWRLAAIGIGHHEGDGIGGHFGALQGGLHRGRQRSIGRADRRCGAPGGGLKGFLRLGERRERKNAPAGHAGPQGQQAAPGSGGRSAGRRKGLCGHGPGV